MIPETTCRGQNDPIKSVSIGWARPHSSLIKSWKCFNLISSVEHQWETRKMPTNLAERAIKLVAKTNKMEKNIKFVALLKVLRESSLKETDRKLLFLEISMCRNCSSVEYPKCVQFDFYNWFRFIKSYTSCRTF